MPEITEFSVNPSNKRVLGIYSMHIHKLIYKLRGKIYFPGEKKPYISNFVDYFILLMILNIILNSNEVNCFM